MTTPRPARGEAGTCEAVEWSVAPGPVPYPEAVAAMEERVAGILGRGAPERVWLLEHPPLYTAGTSARAADLLDTSGLAVYRSGRGGQYTYHGPASGWPMSCSTWRRANAWTCAASSAISSNG